MTETLKLQRARKEHECTMCGSKIMKGEKYWRRQMEETCEDGTKIVSVIAKEHGNCVKEPRKNKGAE